MAGDLDGELRKSKTQTVHIQDLARLSEKPHQAADWRHPVGRSHFSGLTAVLQAPAGRRPGRPHRGQEKAERSGAQDSAEHPPDDRLGVQPRYRAAPRHEKSNAGLRLAKGGAQGDEDPDRRPTQRLLPGGQRQWRVRTLLPRSRHRTAAGRTAGAEMDGCRLRPQSGQGAAGYIPAKRRGGRGPAENEKRLPHTAPVGRRDRRSDATKKKNGQQRMGIPIAHRRSHVTRQRPAYAAKSAETSGSTENTLS